MLLNVLSRRIHLNWCSSFAYRREMILPKQAKQLNRKRAELYKELKEREKVLIEKGVLAEGTKQPEYVHKQNYNFEQYLNYTKTLRLMVEKKEAPKQLHRRARRKYDRPRFNLDLSDYFVWQNANNKLVKLSEHGLPVVCKLLVSPKKLKYVFGEGVEAYRNSASTREFDFEDSNLDQFLIYDYRQTTSYWGPNKDEQKYKNQDHLPPRLRIKSWPEEDQFWESDEPVEFRVNCSLYADHQKFKKWILQEIEEGMKKGESYEERIIKKYGTPEYYTDYNKKYELETDPAVFKYDRSYFLAKGQKLDTTLELNQKLQKPKKLDDKYQISLEDYLKIQQQEQQQQAQNQ